MSVVMEMILLLLFFGGLWAQEVDTEAPQFSTSREPSFSLASNPSSVASDLAVTGDPEEHGRAGRQTSLPSSPPYEVPSPATSITADAGLVAEAMTTRKLPAFQEISNATSDPTAPAMTTLGRHTAAGETMTTSSLETSSGTSGLPVTMTTSSLKTSDGTSGPPITIATSSLETSNGTSGLHVTMATSSLETPKETSGSPISKVKTFMPTPAIAISRGSGPSQSSGQKTKSTLVVAVLVALLVVILLLAFVLLWRRRQKRRTGALTLNRSGKRNGAVDAWAGPARVSDEEAVMAAGVSGGDKGAGVPEGEGPGRRPTLTTFFGRRKSRQDSLALEELKAEPAPSLTGEEEPLVGSEDGAVEAPASDGPEAGDVEVPCSACE